MSRGMRLSVLGLYQYDDTLFNEMKFPAGFSPEEKNTTIGNILAECAELEVLFPDASMMKTMIGLWSKFNYNTWNRIYVASQLEYNPIENYNRTETETTETDTSDTHSGTDTNAQSGIDTQVLSSSGTETNSGTDSNINSITAYDSSNMYAHDKSEFTHGHKVTDSSSGNNSTTYGKTESLTHGEKISREGTVTRENHTSGNIGVTTSQQMLEQEIEVSPKLNLISIICESFKERFCILVY